MSAPDLPAVHWITWDDEDYLATRRNNGWSAMDGSAYFSDVYERATDHGVVIPAGPVDRLVQLPDVGTAVRDIRHWSVDGVIHGDTPGRSGITWKDEAVASLRRAARCLAVARAIDAEKAKPAARERLLAKIAGDRDWCWVTLTVADLRAALAEVSA
jgi:hypothetical protein